MQATHASLVEPRDRPAFLALFAVFMVFGTSMTIIGAALPRILADFNWSSGGQQQQLAIARALAPGPRLLLLDEPTEGIQPSIIKDIGRVIRMLAERKTMAIVLVEQYFDFAAELADAYLVMERGEIVQRGRGATMEADAVRARVSI